MCLPSLQSGEKACKQPEEACAKTERSCPTQRAKTKKVLGKSFAVAFFFAEEKDRGQENGRGKCEEGKPE
jgi:hypothetical protein